jgi:hypothetical protein
MHLEISPFPLDFLYVYVSNVFSSDHVNYMVIAIIYSFSSLILLINLDPILSFD